jgi:dTDP-glucose 4,6-dehydratase
MKKKIFVTGGTGFFGRALIRNWINETNKGAYIGEVTIMSRNPIKFIQNYPEFNGYKWLKMYCGDVNNMESFPKNEKFTHILHAATESTNGPKYLPLERYLQITDGTKNVLEYAVKNEIRRLLLTSSGGVYGEQPLDISEIDENYNGMPDPLIAENAYSIAKRSAEHLCILYGNKYGIETVIARCFSFVGRDLPKKAHFAIGNFIEDALNGNKINILNDGTQVRTYLDQRDLAVWLTTMLYEGKAGQAYNIGSDKQINLLDLAKLIRKVINPSLKINLIGTNNSPQIRARYIPNINKAKKELNLKINYSLEESIIEASINN